MNSIKELFDLQEIELQIEQKKESLTQLEAKLADRQTIIRAQAELDSLKEQANQVVNRQRDLELESGTLQSKLAEVKKKLFAAGKNPKELVSYQQEEKQLKAQLDEKEEALIKLMLDYDNTRAAIAVKEAELRKIKQEWSEKNEALKKDSEKVAGEINLLEQNALLLRSNVSQPMLAEWQSAKEKKKGRIVVRVEQGRCQGCRINMSLSELQKLKHGQEFVRCSHCGRILFLG